MYSEFIEDPLFRQRLAVETEPALRLRESIEEGASLTQAEKFTAAGKPRSWSPTRCS
jgi:hypothetical protein